MRIHKDFAPWIDPPFKVKELGGIKASIAKLEPVSVEGSGLVGSLEGVSAKIVALCLSQVLR